MNWFPIGPRRRKRATPETKSTAPAKATATLPAPEPRRAPAAEPATAPQARPVPVLPAGADPVLAHWTGPGKLNPWSDAVLAAVPGHLRSELEQTVADGGQGPVSDELARALASSEDVAAMLAAVRAGKTGFTLAGPGAAAWSTPDHHPRAARLAAHENQEVRP